ncbi:hypothetical protein BU26DRAFT_254511 [Trematosphaeria pertusa]|uniref:Uncharacterized protein n=1 Tax=Trematosphaeria pertusa TaxID=390896 RepID=A0A6A6IP77_9PLEO|nr:uncharacterized protein BU26DRAFT_254511 [Trematosphaeria pertusa]KAF2252271.1 hypothetical protein BU26DRAFT_254511 [Trematosphaeria pertusa]
MPTFPFRRFRAAASPPPPQDEVDGFRSADLGIPWRLMAFLLYLSILGSQSTFRAVVSDLGSLIDSAAPWGRSKCPRWSSVGIHSAVPQARERRLYCSSDAPRSPLPPRRPLTRRRGSRRAETLASVRLSVKDYKSVPRFLKRFKEAYGDSRLRCVALGHPCGDGISRTVLFFSLVPLHLTKRRLTSMLVRLSLSISRRRRLHGR